MTLYRKTVFIDVKADTEEEAEEKVDSLSARRGTSWS